ncbi:MAG: NACHT domain-containing protein [Cyanobacteria bacterium P01_D01_bin.116]
MKNNKTRTILTICLILIEILLGVFKDTIVEILPGKINLEKYNIDIVTVLIVLIALVIILTFVEFFQEREEHKLNSQNNADYHNVLMKNEQKLKLRKKLIKIVSEEVGSRLEQSLHNRVYIVLNQEKDSSRIENPWEIDVKVAHKPKTRLKNTEIITVFDQQDVSGRLLILGQPGSGKTTMLLKLAEKIVERAKEDSAQPIPVLFSLPTWKDDKHNIKDWLVEQLKDKYGVRTDIGKKWIDLEEIIPLLDGLDELAAERQELCVSKINGFLKLENWTNPLVVCSRTEEYQHYQTLLQLNSSLELCAYSPEQVYKYLWNTNNEGLWNSINNDAELSKLSQTPLFLNIIVIAAQEISMQTWKQFQYRDERLNYLFDAYISRMFKRPYKGKQPTEQQTKKWLGWLSQRLIEEQSTEFLIEKIQPYWLNNYLILKITIFIHTLIFSLYFLTSLNYLLEINIWNIFWLVYVFITPCLPIDLIKQIRIRPVETLRFSLKKTLNFNLISRQSLGLLSGAFLGVSLFLNRGSIKAIIAGVIGGMIGAFFYGMIGPEIETKTYPNQGINK